MEGLIVFVNETYIIGLRFDWFLVFVVIAISCVYLFIQGIVDAPRKNIRPKQETNINKVPRDLWDVFKDD